VRLKKLLRKSHNVCWWNIKVKVFVLNEKLFTIDTKSYHCKFNPFFASFRLCKKQNLKISVRTKFIKFVRFSLLYPVYSKFLGGEDVVTGMSKGATVVNQTE